MSELKQMIKTKAATGGGIGRVREPASPTKAQRAAAQITYGRTPLDRTPMSQKKKEHAEVSPSPPKQRNKML